MISVCLTTHNGQAYILDQLQSILPQLAGGDEVIVSDDASTDDTLALIERLGDARIRIIRQPVRAGATQNFFRALAEAQGDIIFLSDQDDVWLPDKVSECVALLGRYELVVSDARVTDAGLRETAPSLFGLVRSRAGLVYNIIRCTFYGSGMAFRRSLWEAAQPLPRGQYVAHDWWLGLIASLRSEVCFYPKPLYLYRRHSDTVTRVEQGSLLTRSSRPLSVKLLARVQVIYNLIRYLIRHE